MTHARRIVIATVLSAAIGVGAAVAALAALAQSSHDAGRAAAGRIFSADFDSCGYQGWQLAGAASSFQIARSPTVEGTCSSMIVLGPDSANQINAGSDGALMWLSPRYGVSGQQLWQRFFVYFPPDFRATPGDWNWFAEWHNDGGYRPFVERREITWEYANLSWTVRNLRVPRIALRVLGGPSASPKRIWSNAQTRLKLGHWYDILVHVVWSPDPAVGRVDWWLDGKRLLSITTPTLYTRPDGSVSSAAAELGYYRLHADYPARVFYDEALLGTIAASVCLGLPRTVPACPATALSPKAVSRHTG